MVNITEQDVLKRLETESLEIKNTDTERATKKSICDMCPSKQTTFNVDYCDECKCILLFKTAFKYARCPLNKWESEIPPFANNEDTSSQ
jgi:hypothetical protein